MPNADHDHETRRRSLPIMLVSRQNARRLLLLLIVASTGCVPSEKPLSDEKTSTVDEDLIGEWFQVDDETNPLVIQQKDGSPTVLEVVDPAGEDSLPVFCTRIGDQHYLSTVFQVGAKEEYLIIRYEFRDHDTMEWRDLNKTLVTAAIRAEEIKGEIGLYTNITDTPERIRAYLEKHGNDCFDRAPLMALKRKKN
jgi:hypothetical protein